MSFSRNVPRRMKSEMKWKVVVERYVTSLTASIEYIIRLACVYVKRLDIFLETFPYNRAARAFRR